MVYSNGLESRASQEARGFESHLLRQSGFFKWIAPSPRARGEGEPARRLRRILSKLPKNLKNIGSNHIL